MKDLILSNPPLLLAILSILFLIYLILLRLSRKVEFRSKIEKLTIILFMFMLPGINIPVLTNFNPVTLQVPEKSPLVAAVQIFIYAAIFLLLRISPRSIAESGLILFRQGTLSVLLVFLLLSFSWSGNPSMTFLRSIILIFVSLFSTYVARKYDFAEFNRLLLWNSFITALLSIMMATLIPSRGILSSGKTGWRGVLNHPLHLGGVMALGSAVSLIQTIVSPSSRLVSGFLFAVQFIVMQLSNSSGAFISFLAAITVCFLPLFWKRLKFRTVVLFTTLIVILFSIAAIFSATNYQIIFAAVGRDPTLTGRTELWRKIFSVIDQPLWIGYGYDGFWQPWLSSSWHNGQLVMSNPAYPVQRSLGLWAVHAHNGFLDVYLSLGLVGLSLILVSFANNFIRSTNFSVKGYGMPSLLPLLMIVFIFVSNLSESQLVAANHFWFYYVFITVRLSYTKESKKLSSLEIA